MMGTTRPAPRAPAVVVVVACVVATALAFQKGPTTLGGPLARRGASSPSSPSSSQASSVASQQQRTCGTTTTTTTPKGRRRLVATWSTMFSPSSPDLRDLDMRDSWDDDDERETKGVESQGPSPREDEAELTLKIPDRPTLGVAGVFEKTNNGGNDQFILDCLHAQQTWGKIVAYCEDVAAAKKKLISRSARYSGLLDVLEFQPIPEGGVSSIAARQAVMGGGPEKNTAVDAVLAFGVPTADVGAYLQSAAESESVRRVVIATTGPKIEETLSIDSDASSSSSQQKKLDAWSVVAFDSLDAVLDERNDASEGAPLAVDKVLNETELLAGKKPISKADAYRVAAETLLFKPAENRHFVVTAGDDTAAEYMKTLRERGYSRRGELAKLVNGSMTEWVNEAMVKQKRDEEAKRQRLADSAARARERREKMEAKDREREVGPDGRRPRTVAEIAVMNEARRKLTIEWQDNKFDTARGIRKEVYIKYNWERGVREALKQLGYGRDRAIRRASRDTDFETKRREYEGWKDSHEMVPRDRAADTSETGGRNVPRSRRQRMERQQRLRQERERARRAKRAGANPAKSTTSSSSPEAKKTGTDDSLKKGDQQDGDQKGGDQKGGDAPPDATPPDAGGPSSGPPPAGPASGGDVQK